MSEYCYDGQLSSIEASLSEVNDNLLQIKNSLHKLVEIFDPSNKCSCCNKPFDECLSKAFGEMDMIKNKIPIFRSILKTYTCRDCSHQFELPRGYPIVDHPFCPKCNPLKLKTSEESPV